MADPGRRAGAAPRRGRRCPGKGVGHGRPARRPPGDAGAVQERAGRTARLGPVSEYTRTLLRIRWPDGAPKGSYDVVIIGGGGHGLSTAYHLATRHGITNVAVLEADYIA